MVDMRTWMSVDYYHILRVPHTASVDTIRKAYRSLAKEYHPDKGGEERAFHAVSEAYEVLTDPELKNQYDAVRTVAGSRLLDEERFMELVKEAFREGFTEGVDRWRKGKTNRARGHDIKTRITLTEEEAAEGATRPLVIVYETGCPDCMNGCENCENGWLTEEKILTVKTPRGIKDGKRIKIPRAGGKGEQPGDLYIVVTVRPSPERAAFDAASPSIEKYGYPLPADTASEGEDNDIGTENLIGPPTPLPAAEKNPRKASKTGEGASGAMGEGEESEAGENSGDKGGEVSLPADAVAGDAVAGGGNIPGAGDVDEGAGFPVDGKVVVEEEALSDGIDVLEGEEDCDGSVAPAVAKPLGNVSSAATRWKKEVVKPVLKRKPASKVLPRGEDEKMKIPGGSLPHLAKQVRPFEGERLVHPGDAGSDGKSRRAPEPPTKRSRPLSHIRVESPDYFPLNVPRENLGKQVTFVSPRGEDIVFVIPKGVKNAQILRIKGKGKVNPDTLVVEDLLLQVFLVEPSAKKETSTFF